MKRHQMADLLHHRLHHSQSHLVDNINKKLHYIHPKKFIEIEANL